MSKVEEYDSNDIRQKCMKKFDNFVWNNVSTNIHHNKYKMHTNDVQVMIMVCFIT